MFFFKLCLFLILQGISAAKHRVGMELWRIQGNFDDDVLNLFYGRETNGQEIWVRDNRTIDFLLFKEEKDKITDYLKEHGMDYSVLIEDVSEKLKDYLLKSLPTKRSAVSGDSFTWTGFPKLRDINAYLVRMAKKYSTHCKLYQLGKTHRQNPIYMLKISNGNKNNHGILVDAGMHGREYMSVISILYFIDSIIRNYNKQPAHITKKDWHIIPVMNPDGYEYSLSSDPLWKKNRRRISGGCCGVDINRNFDHNFERADDNPCSLHYRGPVAFSEEETKVFKRLTDETNFYGYLSVHSAGSKVLFPMGTSRDEHQIHVTMTRQMALAMREVDNYIFDNGNILKMGINSYGMSMDWMYFTKHVRHSYYIVTRGQIGLDYTEPKHIWVAAEEVVAGLRKFAEET